MAIPRVDVSLQTVERAKGALPDEWRGQNRTKKGFGRDVSEPSSTLPLGNASIKWSRDCVRRASGNTVS